MLLDTAIYCGYSDDYFWFILSITLILSLITNQRLKLINVLQTFSVLTVAYSMLFLTKLLLVLTYFTILLPAASVTSPVTLFSADLLVISDCLTPPWQSCKQSCLYNKV